MTGGMGNVGRLREFGRDVELFLIFNLFAFIGFGVFSVIFNLYLYQLGLRENYIGAFSAIQTLALAASAIAMGTLLHRFGTWRCLTIGVVCFLTVSLLQSLVASSLLLLVLAAANGMSQALLVNTTMPCIIAWTRRHHRQQAAALVYSVIPLATTIGSLAGGLLPSLIHRPFVSIAPDSLEAYRWTLVLGTLVAMIGLVPLLLMQEARHEEPAARRRAPIEPEHELPPQQIRQDMFYWILIGALMGIGSGMLMPFFNVYLTRLGADSQEVGYVYALSGLLAAVIGLGAPWLTRRYGALTAAFWLRLACVPFFLLLIAMPVFGIAVLAFLVRQMTINMAAPIESTFISEVLPGRARTDVFGHRAGAWYVGSALTSIIGGWIIVDHGYSLPILCLVVFSAIPAVVYLVYYTRHPLVRAGDIPSAIPVKVRAESIVADVDVTPAAEEVTVVS